MLQNISILAIIPKWFVQLSRSRIFYPSISEKMVEERGHLNVYHWNGLFINTKDFTNIPILFSKQQLVDDEKTKPICRTCRATKSVYTFVLKIKTKPRFSWLFTPHSLERILIPLVVRYWGRECVLYCRGWHLGWLGSRRLRVDLSSRVANRAIVSRLATRWLSVSNKLHPKPYGRMLQRLPILP